MNPVVFAKLAALGLLTLLGVVLTGVSGFLIIRGPLLGGEILDPGPLFLLSGVFVLGVIVLALGATKLIRALLG